MGISLMESRRRILLNTPHIEAVSGGIATFSTDMAAPLKSCVVTINPVQSGSGDPSPDNVRPISGWDALHITLTDTVWENKGRYWNDKRNFDTRLALSRLLKVEPNTIYTVYNSGPLRFAVQQYENEKETQAENPLINDSSWKTATSYTFTTKAKCNYIWLCQSSPDYSYNITPQDGVYVWLESVDDPAYKVIPITIPTPPGTVYGGTLNLLTGVLTVTWWCHTFDGVNMKASSLAQVPATSDFTYVRGLYGVQLDDLPNDFPYNNSGNRLSSHFLWWAYSSRRNVKPDNICFVSSARVVRWYSSTYTTLQEFNDYLADQYALGTPVQLVYQLPTPVTYQLTPQQLSTLKGVNTIWADCGPVDIKYWKH